MRRTPQALARGDIDRLVRNLRRVSSEQRARYGILDDEGTVVLRDAVERLAHGSNRSGGPRKFVLGLLQDRFGSWTRLISRADDH